jgi:hypothetical protein
MGWTQCGRTRTAFALLRDRPWSSHRSANGLREPVTLINHTDMPHGGCVVVPMSDHRAVADRVMFVQLKPGHNTDKGPCWINVVRFQPIMDDRLPARQDATTLARHVRRQLVRHRHEGAVPGLRPAPGSGRYPIQHHQSGSRLRRTRGAPSLPVRRSTARSRTALINRK